MQVGDAPKSDTTFFYYYLPGAISRLNEEAKAHRHTKETGNFAAPLPPSIPVSVSRRRIYIAKGLLALTQETDCPHTEWAMESPLLYA